MPINYWLLQGQLNSKEGSLCYRSSVLSSTIWLIHYECQGVSYIGTRFQVLGVNVEVSGVRFQVFRRRRIRCQERETKKQKPEH
jgi:hypothetical protein